MKRLILRFIPEALRHDANVFRRARMIIGTAIISTIVSAVYSVQYGIALNAPALGALVLFAGVVLVCVPFVVRSTLSLQLGGNLTVGAYFFTLLALTYFEGGPVGQARYWLCLVPLLATLFNGIRAGSAWILATVVVFTSLTAAKTLGYIFPVIPITPQQNSLQSYLGGVGLAVLLYVLGRQYEQGKNEALQTLDDVRRESERRAADDFRNLELLKMESERRAAADIERIESQKQYLARSVEEILHAVELVSRGDMTVRVSVGKGDDIERLSVGLTETVENIRQMLVRVVRSVYETTDALSHINAETERLATAAEEEASQITQTAGAVEEMSRTIAENTHQSSRAADDATRATAEAERGGEALKTMIDNVRRVGDVVMNSAEKVLRLGNSSQQIGDIVAVIDEIADQTNLLALNAAIEAARAGEQGRGFAVVADEVRKLAERTQNATKQISTMIKTIQADVSQVVDGMNKGRDLVQQGTQLAAQTSSALDQIVQRTRAVADVITEVAVSSEEQSATSNEMARTMTLMTRTVESSTDGVVNIARSLDALMRQASELKHLLGHFSIGAIAASSTVAQTTLLEKPNKHLLPS